jgi:hypothetical protein
MMKLPVNRKTHLKRVTAALSALALAACATATPYQPLGAGGSASGGYASQQLDQNRFRVRFVGNSLTSRERVENYLLYRAAQLTLEQGHDCFTIASRDVERDVDMRLRPGFGRYPGWAPYWRLHGRFGSYYYDPWFDSPFYPDGHDIDTVERYEANAEIVLRRGTCPTDVQTFNAREVIRNLQPLVEQPR